MKRDAVTNGGKPSAARMGSSGYIFEGSAVRRAEEVSRPVKKKIDESAQRERRARRALRERREARADLFVLLFSCVLLIAAGAFFLTMKHTVTDQNSTIRRLETQALNSRNTREALAGEAAAQISMEEIIRIATEEYGMHFPNADQIVHTEATGSAAINGSEENAA